MGCPNVIKLFFITKITCFKTTLSDNGLVSSDTLPPASRQAKSLSKLLSLSLYVCALLCYCVWATIIFACTTILGCMRHYPHYFEYFSGFMQCSSSYFLYFPQSLKLSPPEAEKTYWIIAVQFRKVLQM